MCQYLNSYFIEDKICRIKFVLCDGQSHYVTFEMNLSKYFRFTKLYIYSHIQHTSFVFPLFKCKTLVWRPFCALGVSAMEVRSVLISVSDTKKVFKLKIQRYTLNQCLNTEEKKKTRERSGRIHNAPDPICIQTLCCRVGGVEGSGIGIPVN